MAAVVLWSGNQSRSPRDLLASVSASDDRVLLPTGVTAQKVRLTSYGFVGRTGYQSLRKIAALPSNDVPVEEFGWQSNLWGAVVDRLGRGWFEGDAYRIRDGGFGGTIMVPIQPWNIKRVFELQGSVDRYQVSAQIEVDGGTIRSRIQSLGSERPRYCAIRLSGKYERLNHAVDIDVNDDGAEIRVQPSNPALVLADGGAFNPLDLFSTLQGGGGLGDALFGGVGIGAFVP